MSLATSPSIASRPSPSNFAGTSAGTRDAESVYSAVTGPEPPSTAASSSVARSSGVSVSRRAATRPRMLSGRSGSAVGRISRVAHERGQLLEEERVAPAAVEELVGDATRES